MGQPPPRCRDVPSFRGGKCKKRKNAVGKEKAGAMEQRRETGRKLFIHGMEKCVATRQNDTLHILVTFKPSKCVIQESNIHKNTSNKEQDTNMHCSLSCLEGEASEFENLFLES